MSPVVSELLRQGAAVRLIAGLTVREALRQRLAIGLGLAAAGLVGGVQGLRAFNFGTTELRFVLDLGFGTIGLLGSLLAIALTTTLFFNEIDQRTVQTVLARPVTRGAFLAGKACGVTVVLGLFCATLTAALLALLVWRGDAGVRPFDLALAGLLQAVKLGVLAALTLALATVCRTALLTALLAFLVWAICQLQPVLAEVAAGIDTPAGRWLATAGVACVPDFQAFETTAVLAAGASPDPVAAAGLVSYGTGYILASWAVAAAVFSRREL
jgi:hypothetical protein